MRIACENLPETCSKQIANMTGIHSESRSLETASTSLLNRVLEFDCAAWHRFSQLYAPWVYRLVRRCGLGESDAADVSQEVFMSAAMRIGSFRRDQPGQSLRSWLRAIVRNKVGDWIRQERRNVTTIGGCDPSLSQVADPFVEYAAELSEDAESAEELPLLKRAIELVQTDFEHTTWLCFQRTVLEERSGPDVAAELGMTAKAVRQAKYRVIQRLRAEFGGLVATSDGSLDLLSRGASSIAVDECDELPLGQPTESAQ